MPAVVPGKVQMNITVPEHLDLLVRRAAAERRARTSTIATEIFAEHFGCSPLSVAERRRAARIAAPDKP
jgi:hypothetical protein